MTGIKMKNFQCIDKNKHNKEVLFLNLSLKNTQAFFCKAKKISLNHPNQALNISIKKNQHVPPDTSVQFRLSPKPLSVL